MAGSRSAQFGEVLGSIVRAVSRVERDRVCCGELTFQQFDTLSRIERAPVATIKAIAAALGIDESTASRNMSLLVRDGYLVKKRADGDGREVRLALTVKGSSALSTLQCGEKEVLSGVLERIPAEERPSVLRALRIVDWALSAEEALCCEPTCSSPRRTARSS